MAWARAEGKLMYHCSLAWLWMSWTLVGLLWADYTSYKIVYIVRPRTFRSQL